MLLSKFDDDPLRNTPHLKRKWRLNERKDVITYKNYKKLSNAG